MNQLREGTIIRWIDEKGFGFIRPTQQIDEIFFHIRDYRGQQRPQINETIFYRLDHDKKGRPCAKNVQPARLVQQKIAEQNQRYRTQQAHQQAKETSNSVLNMMLLFSSIYYIGFSLLTYHSSQPIHQLLWLAYTLASLITFIVYAVDKNQAKQEKNRTPEAQLHLWAILGGWIGASFAHKFLNHKSRKTEFRSVYYTTIIINIIVVFFLIFTFRG